MPHALKRTLVWTFWIFLIYAIVKSPETAAELMRNVWQILADGLGAIMTFIDRLVGR